MDSLPCECCQIGLGLNSRVLNTNGIKEARSVWRDVIKFQIVRQWMLLYVFLPKFGFCSFHLQSHKSTLGPVNSNWQYICMQLVAFYIVSILYLLRLQVFTVYSTMYYTYSSLLWTNTVEVYALCIPVRNRNTFLKPCLYFDPLPDE